MKSSGGSQNDENTFDTYPLTGLEHHNQISANSIEIAKQSELALMVSKQLLTKNYIKIAAARLIEYGDVRPSPTIKTLSKLTAPTQNCPFKKNIKCNIQEKYRTIDGSCNNIKRPWLGKSNTPFKRWLTPFYDDGLDSPRLLGISGRLPNARHISLTVHRSMTSKIIVEQNATNLFVIFGQFIAHDLISTAAGTDINGRSVRCICNKINRLCINIPRPNNDTLNIDQKCMVVARNAASFPTVDCKLGHREQLNLITAYLDLSQVYGSNQHTTNDLRLFKGGQLKATKFQNRTYLSHLSLNSCMDDKQGQLCFKSGDGRTNENMGLASLHTMFHREHNRIAHKLSQINSMWNDELLFHETRRIVTAQYQHIIYNEWLPVLLGKRIWINTDLKPLINGYHMKYDEKIDSSISNEFATAVFRFGHSMVTSTMSKVTYRYFLYKNLTFSNISFRNKEAYLDNGLDGILLGMVTDHGEKSDAIMTKQIQQHLFETKDVNSQTKRFDLAALNIIRGRDHGIGPYIAYRRFCRLSVPKSFSTLNHLLKVYKNVEDIDLFTGLLTENPLPNAIVGPTLGCLLARQFQDLKRGDRYFYENGQFDLIKFTTNQLNDIRTVSLSSILCNTIPDLLTIPTRSFLLNTKTMNCQKIKKLNLFHWKT
ncbi:unnamed protein product [Didymodactylos carnosus]|uniref:Peroxidase n=1 Tax=Didymodactylos carnosus TaxID=1234261 RepID=A0A813U2W8_9BILA|nr:unnamed protein product [Didymodactylos carnosus]CAF0820209.1 unnamed protein product [Didymodactylos carnosus]CAF3500570.1 unnamed protein product [Didymodactylos carnosus]CAF3606669.1 unnamed protein product [Didymodactylos carnosus]